MDVRRRWWRALGSSSRGVALTLAFDAYPQHGFEVFNTYMRCAWLCGQGCVPLAPLCGSDGTAMVHVIERTLPCQVLGCGRMAVADKLAALLNQLYLDFGPDLASIRKALSPRSPAC